MTQVPDVSLLPVHTHPIAAESVRDLKAHLDRGGTVVVAVRPGDAVAAELAGVEIIDECPDTEWFVALADRPEAARLDGEVAVCGPLAVLRPTTDEVEVIATTSVRVAHGPTMTRRRCGDGQVIATGVGDLDAVLAHPTLGAYVRRFVSDGDSPRTEDIGVAVVGYGPFGGMGYLHGLACTETEGLRLAAAVDTSPERLEAARRDFGDVAAFSSIDDLLASDAAEVVIIATPPVLHADLARACLDSGRHVVVEKPMCLTASDADDLVSRAAAAGLALSVHQSRRWDTDFLALRRAVETGMIGEVFNIETFVGGFEHPCRAWHSEESVSGGAVYDWGSHHIDWILRLHGSAPERVSCTTHTRVWHDSTNVDQLEVKMIWADRREAAFRQSDLAAIRRPKFYVQGTEGTIEGHYQPLDASRLEPGRGYLSGIHHHAERPVDLRLARYESNWGLLESDLPPVPHPGWGFHRNLADHLLLGDPLAVDPRESRDVVRVLEAAHRSGADGGRVITL